MRPPVRTAAIVGIHWGLVHLRGLREAGCEVVALAAADDARAREAAAREGVATGTSDVAGLNDVDVVVVATPAATHAALLAQLPDPFLICEKPLLGLGGSASSLPDTGGRLLVNYAFPFLRSAAAAADAVTGLGPPRRVSLEVSVSLPLDFTPQAWFLEAASHPLSWLLHLFGRPDVFERRTADRSVEVELRAGGVPVDVRLHLGGDPGIHQRVAMDFGGRELRLQGRYRPGEAWHYDPVLLGGAAITEGERSPTDCWLDANAASVGAMIAVFRGDRSRRDGLAAGLFDAQKALWLEQAIRDDV